MKRAAIISIILFLVISISLFPQDDDRIHYQPAFLPYLVDVVGMGGAFTASSRGYSSLFYNPAGFAMGDYSLTFVSAGPFIYSDPISFLLSSNDDETAYMEQLTGEILSGGYGMGWHAGLGFVKSGLGIGASFIMDSYEYGIDSISDATGSYHMSLGFIIGYAQKFSFSDFVFSIGADIRPMARVYVPISGDAAADLLTSYTNENVDLFEILSEEDALHGLGIGFDAGVIAQYRDFNFGVSFRDIGGTRFDYRVDPFGTVMDSLAESSVFPVDGAIPDGDYIIPMNISAGISYHPDLGELSTIIDPRIHLDFQDIMNILMEEKNPLLMIHCGLEVELFETATALFGFAQGYFSGGVRFHPYFLELNIAFFTEERGSSIGEIPADCLVTEFVVRMKL